MTNSLSSSVTDGLKTVTSLLGIGGTAEGSQRQVTKMDMWRSSDGEGATVLAMSMSMGENHSMHAEKVKDGISSNSSSSSSSN